MERVIASGSDDAVPTLTAHDRCDRCAAQAQVTVLLNSGGVLMFCGHHGRMHQSVLIQQGTIVGDLW